ncbi:integrase [Salmonella enterica subsp. enterica]|uniref:Integrase n=1 Tax=Salmonella enterica subsp. enterica serovar Moero TaxID=2500154 RepID=A0A3Q9M887_SALET|nr:integrase [Salmonella enterica subsp. enterica serovar Moero]EAA6410695.1 integrase [Salmonella enterica subsp. enterica serovar Moroto]EAA7324387.1 integrase [Salmonella enterica subsp. enterica]ECD5356686.1 integrase [Salmonella enterica subsp. enterica serovar Telaviv]AZT05909.1 integrase [Salmonella enterica subsp. enterica serovar Moero]
MKTYIINDSEVSKLSVAIHRYAHLAPNHLTEYARQIHSNFSGDVPNMSHMENKEEIKKRNALIYKWRALQDSNLRPTA